MSYCIVCHVGSILPACGPHIQYLGLSRTQEAYNTKARRKAPIPESLGQGWLVEVSIRLLVVVVQSKPRSTWRMASLQGSHHKDNQKLDSQII